MATFNACAIKADSKTRELDDCASSCNIGILGVQEHRIIHQLPLEVLWIEDRYLVTSPAWRNEAQASVGVGLLLCSKAKDALCDVKSYFLRVLRAIFCSNPATTVIVAYIFSDKCHENVVEDFYDTLRAAIYDTPAHNFLCVLGTAFRARRCPVPISQVHE